MNRYLLHFSYIGTGFRGVQKNVPKADVKELDSTTVQGVLEIALRNFKPKNEPAVCVSSRTDTGVHALHTTAHVDLERQCDEIYNPNGITVGLNKFFNNENIGVRIIKTQIVPFSFHSRFSAKKRTYLYRLAIAKKEYVEEHKIRINHINNKLMQIPIEELNRCHFISNPCFDIDAARAASLLIEGRHDFRTFMGTSRNMDPSLSTIRTLQELSITPGQGSVFPYSTGNDLFDYWNIILKSKGFLYRQVRRTVAILVAVAQGRLSLRDVRTMLQVPSPNSWAPHCFVMPPHALYLCKVDYNPQDLMSDDTKN